MIDSLREALIGAWWEHLSEIIVALLGFLGICASSWIGWVKWRAQAQRALRTEQELKFQAGALDFSAFLQEWDGVHHDLKTLMEETEIDRFLILRAWNGTLAPRWTTAVFQMRQGNQDPISYVHFELDEDYVARLRTIAKDGPVLLDVEHTPPSAIKDIYEAEGVTASAWFHLETSTIPEAPGCAAITYCSFATHDLEKMNDSTFTRCRTIAGRLKGVSAAFRADPSSKG